MAKRRPGRDDETHGALSREEARLFREQAGEVRPIRQERASPRSAPSPTRNVPERKQAPSPAPESDTKTAGNAVRPLESTVSPPPKQSAEGATGTNDDTSIFQQVMADTRKIEQPERAPPVRRRPPPRPSRPAPSPRAPSPGYEAEADGIGVGSRLTYKAPGIQNREWQKFQRGRHRIEADLDLHGLPSADAERRMMEFIADARARGLRCVCVVHGKGRSSAGGQAILKKMVDRSLRHCGDVLAFCSSPDHRGGTGAVDVLLRKKAGDS